MYKKTIIQQELETEQRTKKQVVFETTNQIVDTVTGEILRQESTQKIKTTTEPDFIKVYYKAMLAVNNIDKMPIDFVLALASVITYCNDNKPIYFHNNKTNRDLIAECCLKRDGQPISDNMVSRYIKDAKDLGLLFETPHRGTYEVNPCMIAKGQWKNINKLQASFDFTDGRWTRTMTLANQSEEPDNNNMRENRESA